MEDYIYQKIDDRMLIPVELINYSIRQTKIEISVNRYYQDDLNRVGPGYELSLNGYLLSYKYISHFFKLIGGSSEFDVDNPFNRFSVYSDNNEESSRILEKYNGYYDSVYERFYEDELVGLSLAMKFNTKMGEATNPITLSGFYMINRSTTQLFIGCHYKKDKVHNQLYYYVSSNDLYDRSDGDKIKNIINKSSGFTDFNFPVDKKWKKIRDVGLSSESPFD